MITIIRSWAHLRRVLCIFLEIELAVFCEREFPELMKVKP